MKSLKTKLPPGFRFDREEANERSEPGHQSTEASAENNWDLTPITDRLARLSARNNWDLTPITHPNDPKSR
jgi:hypothetical protein